ncbi:MAG: hypothetical protein R3C28_23355 [Pirellulaceae bacterium]
MSSFNPYQAPEGDTSGISPAESYQTSGHITVKEYKMVMRLLQNKRTRVKGWLLTIWAIAFVAFFGLLGVVVIQTVPEYTFRIIFVVGLLMGLMFVKPIYVWRTLRRMEAERFGIFADMQSFYSPSGIVKNSGGTQTEYSWAVCTTMVANDTVGAIHIKNTGIWLVLARSRLTQPGDWDSFLDFIRMQIALARDTEPPATATSEP